MPELAEVEYFRKQWDSGVGKAVRKVHLHAPTRLFRGGNADRFRRLVGERLVGSEAAGKQMLFRFTSGIWIGIHLGMTGKLSVAGPDYEPGKHDHLVLYQGKQALIFNDARQFGRVLFHQGKEAPDWWSEIPPAVFSREFSVEKMAEFLRRHHRLPIKAALLLQKGFPGIGNWMADEILWRAGIAPGGGAGSLRLEEQRKLWREVRWVARQAIARIGTDYGDPPANWLFHERWKRDGLCPKHKKMLRRDTIGGRTTVWCPRCQRRR